MNEEQLQFLYDNYAKDKGFSDISEFKSLIQDDGAREIFFNESNKELGFKDLDEFNSLLGISSEKKNKVQSGSGVATVTLDLEQENQQKQEEGGISDITESTNKIPLGDVETKQSQDTKPIQQLEFENKKWDFTEYSIESNEGIKQLAQEGRKAYSISEEELAEIDQEIEISLAEEKRNKLEAQQNAEDSFLAKLFNPPARAILKTLGASDDVANVFEAGKGAKQIAEFTRELFFGNYLDSELKEAEYALKKEGKSPKDADYEKQLQETAIEIKKQNLVTSKLEKKQTEFIEDIGEGGRKLLNSFIETEYKKVTEIDPKLKEKLALSDKIFSETNADFEQKITEFDGLQEDLETYLDQAQKNNIPEQEIQNEVNQIFELIEQKRQEALLLLEERNKIASVVNKNQEEYFNNLENIGSLEQEKDMFDRRYDFLSVKGYTLAAAGMNALSAVTAAGAKAVEASVDLPKLLAMELVMIGQEEEIKDIFRKAYAKNYKHFGATASDDALKILSKYGLSVAEKEKEIEESLRKKIKKPKEFSNSDTFLDVLDTSVMGIIESTPLLLAAGFSGPIGGSILFGAQGAGDQYFKQMDLIESGREEYSPLKIYGAMGGSYLAQQANFFGTKYMLKNNARLLKASKSDNKINFRGKAEILGKNTVVQGIAERLVATSEALVSNIFNDENLPLFDRGMNPTYGGMSMAILTGTTSTLGGYAMRGFASQQQKKQSSQIYERMQDIEKRLKLDQLEEFEFEILRNEFLELADQAKEISDNIAKNTANLTQEEFDFVNESDKTISDAKKEVKKVQSSKNLTLKEKQNRIDKIKKDVEEIVSRKEKILSEAQEREGGVFDGLISVDANQSVSFEYNNISEIPWQLKRLTPINKSEIQQGKNKKIRLTFSGKQLIDVGLAKENIKQQPQDEPAGNKQEEAQERERRVSDELLPIDARRTFLEETIGKTYTYNDPVSGQEVTGEIIFDGQEVILKDGNSEYSLGSVQDAVEKGSLPIKEVKAKFTFNEDGTLSYKGDSFEQGNITLQGGGLTSVRMDKNGNVKRVIVTDSQGNTRNIKGQEANELVEVILLDMALKKDGGLETKINSDETAKQTFERAVNDQVQKTAEEKSNRDSKAGLQKRNAGRIIPKQPQDEPEPNKNKQANENIQPESDTDSQDVEKAGNQQEGVGEVVNQNPKQDKGNRQKVLEYPQERGSQNQERQKSKPLRKKEKKYTKIEPSTNKKRGGDEIVNIDSIKKNLPTLYKFLSRYKGFESLGRGDIENLRASLYDKLMKYKSGAENVLSQIKEIETVLEDFEQSFQKVSKEDFKKQMIDSRDFNRNQLDILFEIVDSINSDFMPEYNSHKESLQLAGLKPVNNFYAVATNIISSKDPEAFIHEIGHFAFYKILTVDDRIAFMEYAISSTYGKEGKSIAERLAMTSEKVTKTVNGEVYTLSTNVANNFDEYFAEQFRQWYMGEKMSSKKIETIFEKVLDYMRSIVDKIISKKYIDKNLIPFFEKIISESPIKEKKNSKPLRAKEAVKEINNLPLTRIEGLGMGASQAEGTYISTEKKGNRYKASNPNAKVRKVSVKIKNPLVVTNDTGLVGMRNKMLNKNRDQFTAEDFEMFEVPNTKDLSIDDLNDAGIAKLAKIVTNDLKNKGYDAIYFPESNTQEGELVVFDRKNVVVEGGKKQISKKEKTSKEKQDSPELKEVNKQIKEAQEQLKKAKTALQNKAKELDEKIIEDQEDLFGDRKSKQKNALFDERVELSERAKATEKERQAVKKAEENLKKLKKQKEKIAEGKNVTQKINFDEKPKETPIKNKVKRIKSNKVRGEFDVEINPEGKVVKITSVKSGKEINKFIERKVKPTKNNPKGIKLSVNANYSKIESVALGVKTSNELKAEKNKKIKKLIANFEPSSAYEMALYYFARGEKVNPISATKETIATNKKNKSESWFAPELKWLAGFEKFNKLPSVERIAHILWQSDENKNFQFDTMELRTEINNVISSFSSYKEIQDALLDARDAKIEEERYQALNDMTEQERELVIAIEVEDAYIEELTEQEVIEYYKQQIKEYEQGKQAITDQESKENDQRKKSSNTSGDRTQKQQKDNQEVAKKQKDKVEDFIEKIEKELDEFGKGTLGINLPVFVAKQVVGIVKNAYKAGKSIKEATQEALEYIKNTDWYKSLSTKEKAEINAKTVLQTVKKDVLREKEEITNSMGFFGARTERDLLLSEDGPVGTLDEAQKKAIRFYNQTLKTDAGTIKPIANAIRSLDRQRSSLTTSLEHEMLVAIKVMKEIKKEQELNTREASLLLNLYLTGQADINASNLSQESKDTVNQLRKRVDDLSSQLQDVLSQQFEDLNKKLESTKEGTKKHKDISDSIESLTNLIEKIENNKGKYLYTSYEAFRNKKYLQRMTGTNPKPENRRRINNAVKYLMNEAVENGEELSEAEARKKVFKYLDSLKKEEDIIGATSSGLASAPFLKKKKELPLEFRELLGESKDPFVNYASTVYKVSNYLAALKYQENLKSILLETGLGSYDAEEGFTMLNKNNSYSNIILKGLYVTDETYNSIQDLMPLEQITNDFYKSWVAFAAFTKIGKTILSPTTMFRNFLSGIFLGFNAGFFFAASPEKMKDAYNLAWGTSKSRAELKTESEKLYNYGVLGDGAASGDLMATMNDMHKDLDRITNKTTLKKAYNILAKAYAFGDDFYKVIGYYTYVNRYKKHGFTQQEAESKAAQRIVDTMPTYSMLPRNIQKLRRNPFTSTFISFPYEVMRTTVNGFKYIKEDVLAGRKDMVAKQVAGMAIANATALALGWWSKSMMGFDDDDDDKIRDMLPHYQTNSKLIYFGKDEYGDPRFMDATAMFPAEVYLKPLRTLLKSREGRSVEDQIYEATKEFFSPAGADISAQTMFEILTNKNTFDRKIYEGDNLVEGVINNPGAIMHHYLKNAGPGFYNNFTEFAKANNLSPEYFGDKYSSYGREYTNRDALMALLGFRITTLNYKTALTSLAYDNKNQFIETKQKVASKLSKPRLLENKDLEKLVKKQSEANKKMSNSLSLAYKGAKKLGLKESEIATAYKQAKFTDDDIQNITKGFSAPMKEIETQKVSEKTDAIDFRFNDKDLSKDLQIKYIKNVIRFNDLLTKKNISNAKEEFRNRKK